MPRVLRPVRWDALAPALREIVEAPDAGPARLLKPRPDLVVRRETTRSGRALRFAGPDASDMLMDAVFDGIDRPFSPV